MSKELALHQLGGNSPAIHCHEGLTRTVGLLVYGMSDQLFARTALTVNQYAGSSRRNRTDQLHELPSMRTVSNNRLRHG